MGYIDPRIVAELREEAKSRPQVIESKDTSYGDDPYSYAFGDNLSGCYLRFPSRKDKDKRDECNRAFDAAKLAGETSQAQLEQAVISRSQSPSREGLSGGAIAGIAIGSILALTVMVVVIKKVRSKK